MIYFVRHGESEANAMGVFSGSNADPELTKKGEEQAKEAGEELLSQNIQIERIISSPLKRAVKTAEIIASIIGFDPKEIQKDIRITEYNVGALAGQPHTDVTAEQLMSTEGIEDPQKFMDRTILLLEEYVDKPGNTLISSHAGVGRVIEAHKQGLSPDGFLDIKAYPNAHIVKLDRF